MRSSNAVERLLNRWYVKWIRPRIGEEINRQRLKLLYDVWGYAPLLTISTLGAAERVALVARFVRVDWNVVHAHKPIEIATVCKHIGARRARPGEAVVEAGCWNGGSSAKFSLICARLGYHLFVYDSFEGVAKVALPKGEFDFAGSYASSEEAVASNIARYGDITICTLTKGWFADTLARAPLTSPVRTAYIDCDIASGTLEALTGVVPALVQDGQVFSQDFHLAPVRELLEDPATWESLGKSPPAIRSRAQLAAIEFE